MTVKRFFIPFLSLCAFVFTGAAWAQEETSGSKKPPQKEVYLTDDPTSQPQQLSLQEAVNFALEHNKSLKVSRLNMQLYQKKVLEAISAGIPQVSAGLNYQTYFGAELDMSKRGGGTSSSTGTSLEGSPGSPAPGSNPLMDSIRSMIATMLGSVMGQNSGLKIPMEDNLSLTATAQWALSGQWVVGMQTSKMAKKMMGQQTALDELDVKANIYNSYHTILATEHIIETLKENLQNMAEILEHTMNMYNAGVLEESDVDQIRITVGQLSNTLLAMNRTVDLNYNLLRIQMGLKAGTPITLTEKLETFLGEEGFEKLALQYFNVESNLSYQMVQTQEQLQKKAVSAAIWACAPTLVAAYNYQYQILEGGFMNLPHTATVQLNVPIFSGLKRKSQIDQQKITLQQTQLNKSLVEDQLLLQESQLKYNLQSAMENYKLQTENVEVAQKVLNHYRAKYEVGRISSLDLTQANTNYLTAENNYTSACLELLQAQTALLKLYNELN